MAICDPNDCNTEGAQTITTFGDGDSGFGMNTADELVSVEGTGSHMSLADHTHAAPTGLARQDHLHVLGNNIVNGLFDYTQTGPEFTAVAGQGFDGTTITVSDPMDIVVNDGLTINLTPPLYVQQEIAVIAKGTIKWSPLLDRAEIWTGEKWDALMSGQELRERYDGAKEKAKQETLPNRFAMVAMDAEGLDYDAPEEVEKREHDKAVSELTKQIVADALNAFSKLYDEKTVEKDNGQLQVQA